MNTYPSDSEKFKNLPTRRFYDYFYPRLKEKAIDTDDFFEKMGVGINVMNRMQFFTQMKTGHKGITMDQVAHAWNHYGVTPNYLFGLTNETGTGESVVLEPGVAYLPEIKKDIMQIRKLIERVFDAMNK